MSTEPSTDTGTPPADTGTAPAAPAAPEPTKPMAGDGEVSVSSNNMSGSPGAKMPGDEPAEPSETLDALAKTVQSTLPLGMSDGDATKLGRDVESRYLPPAQTKNARIPPFATPV